ncbi:unnamed protein product, partial [marine sediment metagenome]
LNENVIIGKMIPARYPTYEEISEGEEVPELVAGEEGKEEEIPEGEKVPELVAGEEGKEELAI